MPITAAELEHRITRSSLGDSSRDFFLAIALPELKKAKSHAAKFKGLSEIVGNLGDGPRSDLIWTMTFTYCGQRFLIDTNYHAGLSQFYVADPDCSDEVLLQVLNHFDRSSALLSYAEDEPIPRSARIVGFILMGFCVIFAVNSVICLSSGEFGSAVGGAIVSIVCGWCAKGTIW